jgi:hypothetical protein
MGLLADGENVVALSVKNPGKISGKIRFGKFF